MYVPIDDSNNKIPDQIMWRGFILHSVVNDIFSRNFLRLAFFGSFLGNAKKNKKFMKKGCFLTPALVLSTASSLIPFSRSLGMDKQKK
ncbi:hypothetical protein EV197_0349 [Aquimarina brevivitae]|uniref:Uncharacterized protein n=1 Tax=Aquimarina brevivitae TaxID=323412 RepID=A0A4Q7PFB4_9FLAO|nr:hypothetical protein EV197_0349 [Aquimarina brevivitae]